MICKVCGKALNEGDRFCSGCGSRVLGTEFFDSRQQEHDNEQGRAVSHEEFNWNLDGYPSENTKKTEDVEFDWKSVNFNNGNRNIGADRIPAWRTSGEQIPEAEAEKDEPVSLEELFADPGENSEFGTEEPTKQYNDSKTVKLDKFYTFNKKNEEFQALLDREYEKVQAGEADTDNYISQEAESDSEPEISEVTDDGFHGEAAEEKPLPEENTFCFSDAKPGLLCVVLSETPACITAASPDEGKKEEKGKTQEPEGRLTFEDVFREDDEDEEGTPKKKSGVLKTLAVILCILIVLELVMIGVQYFAPDSALAQKFNEIYLYIVNRITSIV